MGILESVRSVGRLAAGLLLASAAVASPAVASGAVASAAPAPADRADPRLLYATWRWVETEGDSTVEPGAFTPDGCRCEGLLILNGDGEYEFVVQDSVRETRLWRGIFTVHRPPDGAEGAIEGGPADFLVSFTGWWVDSERDQLMRFAGPDTLVTVSTRPGLSGQPTLRWYVRAATQISPGGPDLPGFIEPEPSTMVQPVFPDSLIRRGLHGEIKLQVLVGTDGLVKNIKVIAAPPGMSEPVVEAVRKWVFKPARIRGKPIAVWIEMPIRFEE